MVGGPGELYRVFFGPAQAGSGLARVEKAYARAFQLPDVAGREIGYAGKMADEVEDDAFRPQKDCGVGLEMHDLGHGGDGAAFLYQKLLAERSVHLPENFRDNRQAGDHGFFLGRDARLHGDVRREDADAGQVLPVLVECEADSSVKKFEALLRKIFSPRRCHACPL